MVAKVRSYVSARNDSYLGTCFGYIPEYIQNKKNLLLSTFKLLTKFSTLRCRTKVPISLSLSARDCPLSCRRCLHFLACGLLYLQRQMWNVHSFLPRLQTFNSFFYQSGKSLLLKAYVIRLGPPRYSSFCHMK